MLTTTVEIVCDDCRAAFVTGDAHPIKADRWPGRTLTENCRTVLEKATGQGWKIGPNGHVCPDCAETPKAHAAETPDRGI